MTISGPDLSNYQGALNIQPGTAFVIAKATEGQYYQDASFHKFQNQSASVGALFSGYHFLVADGNPEGQADYYWNYAGATPCMIDQETEGSSMPDTGYTLRFINRLAARGGRVWALYLPNWYWNEIGRPELGFSGVSLVASDYVAYSDTGPGWAPYGGASPALWQYTDRQPYAGESVDFNAYRGTVDQLSALIHGTVVPPSPTPSGDDDIVGSALVSPNIPGQFPDLPDMASKFPPNSMADVPNAVIWADARAAAAAEYAKQARDEVSALALQVDALQTAVDAIKAKLGA